MITDDEMRERIDRMERKIADIQYVAHAVVAVAAGAIAYHIAGRVDLSGDWRWAIAIAVFFASGAYLEYKTRHSDSNQPRT